MGGATVLTGCVPEGPRAAPGQKRPWRNVPDDKGHHPECQVPAGEWVPQRKEKKAGGDQLTEPTVRPAETPVPARHHVGAEG